MKTEDIIQILREHQPADAGRVTFTEGFGFVDLLSVVLWGTPRHQQGDRIGFEVKVSRGDLRSELNNPEKTAKMTSRCHESYFVMPHGMLADAEIQATEPWREKGSTRSLLYIPPECGVLVVQDGVLKSARECVRQDPQLSDADVAILVRDRMIPPELMKAADDFRRLVGMTQNALAAVGQLPEQGEQEDGR